MNQSRYRVVIGIEVHVQLNTLTKAFCSCKNEADFLRPNTNICPICVGEPGVLPFLNMEMVKKSIKIATALNCKINKNFRFDRKNYFYPDLPKGYQITQYDYPIGFEGFLMIITEKGDLKRIGIERVHMEEDTAKMLHDYKYNETLIDFNRAGIPLVEIVSRPDMETPEEAVNYVKMLKRTLEFINVSECSLEKGSMRTDLNISVNFKDAPLSHKVEIKNLNSFASIRKSLEYEIKRQTELLENNKPIKTETMLFDVEREITIPMRSKELASDYRYFPEPDIPFIELNEEFINDSISDIGELPYEMYVRFIKEYNLSGYLSDILTSDKKIAEYYEKAVKISSSPLKTANLLVSDIFGYLNKNGLSIDMISLAPEKFGLIIKDIEKKRISEKSFKQHLNKLLSGELKFEKFKEISSILNNPDEIKSMVLQIIQTERDDAVKKYLNGKESVFGYLVGQVMKLSKGKADAGLVNRILKEELTRLKSNYN